MSWLTSSWGELAVVAAKAVLIYLTALIGFVAAVAMGAIVARTALADNQSYEAGVVALLTIVVAHRLLSLLRFAPLVAKLVDHRIRVLVVDGQVRRGQLRLCGSTDNDLFAELRLRGVFELSQVRYVLYESKGGLSIMRDDPAVANGLLADGPRDATGYQMPPQQPKRPSPEDV